MTDGANARQKQRSDRWGKCNAKAAVTDGANARQKQHSDRWGKCKAKAAVTDGANAMQKQHSGRWSKCNKYINGSPVSEGGEMYTEFFFHKF